LDKGSIEGELRDRIRDKSEIEFKDDRVVSSGLVGVE
jgi:hypothetical protein